MPKIYLYAEILTHIRQLSLHASLQTAKAEGTKVDVSTDKKVITVTHDGETQKLYLPTQISGTAQVIFPIEKKTEISARVQIDDEHEWKCNISNEVEAPWMAADLDKETAVQCRQCNAQILSSNVINEWKDLPSENWAELMDFWFCHKPQDETAASADDAAKAKGYSSKSKVAIASGIGMTDLTSIVLHNSDCQNIQVSHHQPIDRFTGEKKETSSAQSGLVSDTIAEDRLSSHHRDQPLHQDGRSRLCPTGPDTISLLRSERVPVQEDKASGNTQLTYGQAHEQQGKKDTSMLRCGQCRSLLGSSNPSEGFFRLCKSSISVNSTEALTTFQHYPASIFICAQILSLIESTALKKFVVHSSASSSTSKDKQPATETLIIWVFNPDIYYSCSAYDGSISSPTVTRSPEVTHNPHGDDTSQIYGEEASDTQDNGISKAATDRREADQTIGCPDESSRHAATRAGNNDDAPHQRRRSDDDTSKTHGTFEGPQLIQGEIELEVPISANKRSEAENGSHPYIDAIANSETPHVSSTSSVNGRDDSISLTASHPRSAQTSNEHVNLVHRATKIFYKPLPTGQTPASFLDANSATHEELYLPNPAEFADLHETLDRSNGILPASAKAFQEWKVGLLDRYEKNPSGLGVMQENPLARGIKSKDGRVTRWSLGNGAEGLYA